MGTVLQTNEWVSLLKPSPTHHIMREVGEMRQKGIKVHDFGIGEMHPAILVPEIFKERAKQAFDNDETYYISSYGDAELLEALSADFSRNFGLNYSKKQIVICPGPKDALFKACMAVLSPTQKRNRVVVYSPIFEVFNDAPLLLTGKEPITLGTDENFYPVEADLQNLLATDDTIAMIVFNSPNNPTGAVYPSTLLESLSNVIKQYPHIVVVFDEVYRTVSYETKYTNIAKFLPQQTLTVGGISKEVAGTGLRLGYVAGPEELITLINKVQATASSCVALPIQKGYAHLLKSDPDLKIRNIVREELQKKRDCIEAEIKKHAVLLKAFKYHIPEGAFYFFPNIEALYGKKTPEGKVIESDIDVSAYLLEHGHVATIPGSAFGRKHHIRFAYAKSLTQIEEGMEALADAISKLA